MKQCAVAIAGLGARGLDVYAQCAKRFPEKMKITAVADVREHRVALAAQQFDLQAEQCFCGFDEMMEQEQLADILVLCTQDRQHVAQAIKAMRKGYHILLEKPISPDLQECREILKVAEETKRQVIVCHVLRFTPFYNKLKELLDAGTIGEIVCIQHIEDVGYWHQAHSFVRGNWNNSNTTSPMIMQKCCHDFDILLWLTGKHCKSVSSFGGTYLFKPEKAPAGAAKRCLDGCKARDNCPYDAEKIYITNPETGVRHGRIGWPANVLNAHPTEENIRKALQEGPYGCCVYACDNNVVDHQVVNMAMTDGTAMQMTMCAFTPFGGRLSTIMGTHGEITADLHNEKIVVKPHGGESYEIKVSIEETDLKGHAGGDERMVEEFLDVISGRIAPTVRNTTLESSLESHFIALATELSRQEDGRLVTIQEVSKD